MLDLVKCEFWKLKRRRLFQAAFLTTFIIPLLYTLILSDANLDNMMSVVREENGFLILMPLSVVLAANLFFEEHDHDTLKNLMCIPVSKNRLALAKFAVIFLFDVGYMFVGYGTAILLSVLTGVPLGGLVLQLFLTLGTGALLFAAAMPCIFLVVWCNKSYIISVIIAFAYTVFNYILRINDSFMMVPLGLNVATFLPVPVIFRWLYQFHSLEDAGEIMREFYHRFSPYFVSTPAVFGILFGEGVVFMVLMMKVYRKQSV